MPVTRFGRAKRTRADREMDLRMFLANARDEKLAETSCERLAEMHGVPLKRVREIRFGGRNV